MKTTKMKIAGIALDSNLFNPVIILKNSRGRIFPVPSGFYDKKSLIGAFIHKNSVHSELVVKLMSLSKVRIDKVVLDKNDFSKLVAKVFVSGERNKVFELSATAGILLCVEAEIDITVNTELFRDQSFFKNKIDEKKIFNDFERILFDGIESADLTKLFDTGKETVQ